MGADVLRVPCWLALAVVCLMGVGLVACGLLPAMPTQQESGAYAYTTWDATESPNYYRVVGPAEVVDPPEPGEVWYGPLDVLGRATSARVTVTHDLMEAGIARERADTSSLYPSGWGSNAKVDIPLADGGTYHGYFWNRSHLVAKSLGGAELLENLITGTRMQNVGANDGKGGMAWCETTCRTWLEANPQGSVYYAATPVYEGRELVPRSVVVDMRSSDGALDQRVEVYNAALGFSIDYANGTFKPQ